MTRFHNIRCNKYISKKTWNFIAEAAKKILIVFGQWAFHVSLKKLGLLAMLRSGSGIFEKDFKQCQYRVQKTCIIPQMRNSKSKLIKLIVEKHLWLQLMLGIWRCCCRWVEKTIFVAMHRSYCYRYMVCTSDKQLKSDVILKTQNSPAKGQIHCTPSPLPWVRWRNSDGPFRHTFVSWQRQSHPPSLRAKWYKKRPKWGKVQDHFSTPPAWTVNNKNHQQP